MLIETEFGIQKLEHSGSNGKMSAASCWNFSIPEGWVSRYLSRGR